MAAVVVGQFRLPPERMDEARGAMRKVMEATRAEAGCIEYNYAEDVLDPGLIRVSEVWESSAHLAAHLKTAHMAVWGEERAALGLTGRSIKVFEADEGTAF
ncbi:MAG: antibiotic biosynthesis monooxygenase [Novosphingobium sp.]|uniref:putative quinol monooxygenase n=1 Tax=Novosphingobium sp. TaxID=1874826 RepID=UPI00262648C3|nr:putative quinol monooxygenase [Novosphingobium sp.]MCP5385509.1 antibiotic biosynthesis monooxygenase [Novosphingobium sp.]HNN56063.1 putative quinol monooxygenase [Novosphingobium sp.]